MDELVQGSSPGMELGLSGSDPLHIVTALSRTNLSFWLAGVSIQDASNSVIVIVLPLLLFICRLNCLGDGLPKPPAVILPQVCVGVRDGKGVAVRVLVGICVVVAVGVRDGVKIFVKAAVAVRVRVSDVAVGEPVVGCGVEEVGVG